MTTKMRIATRITAALGAGALMVAPASAASGCVSRVYGVGNSGTCVKYIQILANHKLPVIWP